MVMQSARFIFARSCSCAHILRRRFCFERDQVAKTRIGFCHGWSRIDAEPSFRPLLPRLAGKRLARSARPAPPRIERDISKLLDHRRRCPQQRREEHRSAVGLRLASAPRSEFNRSTGQTRQGSTPPCDEFGARSKRLLDICSIASQFHQRGLCAHDLSRRLSLEQASTATDPESLCPCSSPKETVTLTRRWFCAKSQ